MAKQVNGALLFGIGLNTDQLRADALQSERIFQGIGNTAVAEGARIDHTFRNIAKSVGLVFGAQQGIQFARSIVQVRGEFQKLEAAFGVLLGNKEQADKLMREAIQLAATTPFGLQDVSTGAKQLLAYGFAAEDITEDLRRLGDIASALGLPLERLTYLYGTTRTQGRLYARDMLQFTTSGVPLLQALADQFGVTTNEINAMVTAGEIGFPEVQKAIYAMTGEGGQFNNMMGEMAKTIPGQIEKLKDAWQVALNEIGKEQQGFINSVIAGAASAVEHYKPLLEILKTIIVAYGAYKAATMLTSVVEQSNANVRYNAEIQALQALVTAKGQNTNADLQQMVADRQLTTVQAEKIATLRAVLAEQLKTAQAEAAAARVAVKSAKEAIIADGYRVSALKAKVSALHEQYAAEVAAGNTTKANTILEKANAQAKQFRAAQASLAARQEQLSSLQQAASSKVLAANTLQQGINTAAKTAGAVATNIFTAAANLASKAVKGLTTAIKANPFGWLLTAVMLAVQAFQYFKRRAEESEEALKKLREEQERLTNRQKEYIAQLATEQTEIDILFGKLRVLTEGTREYNRTKEQIISRYGQYLNGLSEEIRKLNDVAGAYRAISSAALQAARDRIVSEATTASATDFAKKEADGFSRLRRNIIETWGYGKEQGEQLFSAIRQFYEDGIEVDAEMRAEFERRMQERGKDKIAYGIGSWKLDSTDQFWNYYIQPYLTTLEKGRTAMNAEISEIESILGTIYKNKPDDSPFVTYAQQVANTTEEVARLKSDLKSLRAGVAPEGLGKGEQFDFAAGIDEKQKALKDAEGRLNTLLGIDPKAYDRAVSDAKDQAKKLAELRAQLASDVAQAEINAMNEGFEKKRAQRLFNAKQDLEDERNRFAEIAKLQKGDLTADSLRNRYDDSDANRAALLAGGLTKAQVKQFYSIIKNLRTQFANDMAGIDKEENNAALNGFRSFEQEYLRLYEEYQDKRKRAEASGADAAGLANADAVFDKSIKDLASKFAENNPEFTAWAEGIKLLVDNAVKNGSTEIINKAIDDLQSAIATAKAKLESLASGGIDAGEANEYGDALAKIAKLEAELQSLQSKGAAKEVDSDWKKTYSTLQKISREFSDIGESIGGVAGDAIKTAGTIATSTLTMISSIQQYGMLSMQMTKLTAGTTAMAIKQVERASVILAIIGVVIQVIQTVTGLFKDNKQAMEDAANAAREYDAALREIELSRRYDLFDTIFGVDAIGKFQEAKKISIESLQAIKDEVEGIQNRTMNILGKAISDPIEATYDGRSGWNKFWGSGDHKIKHEYFDVNKYFDSDGSTSKAQQDALKAWYDAHKNALDSAEKEILEGLIAHGEAYVEATQIMKEHLQDLFGDLASSIADNMVEAFEETGNAAENMGDIVQDVAKSIATSMIQKKLFDEIFNSDFQDKISALIAENNMEAANAEIASAIDRAEALAPEIEKILSAFGLVTDTAERMASEKGIASASQDSINELNGRATAIQGHTYAIMESHKMLLANSANILNHLANIEANTARLEYIQSDTKAMRQTLSDAYMRGWIMR